MAIAGRKFKQSCWEKMRHDNIGRGGEMPSAQSLGFLYIYKVQIKPPFALSKRSLCLDTQRFHLGMMKNKVNAAGS